LAREWTAGIPAGWGQVEAIVSRLRTDYVLDWQAVPPPSCTDTVEWFLFESRRGSDYHFATAACILLRHLGYATRLACGWYARADAFDAESRHTPVTEDDVHFWPEVRVASRYWVVIEPTPGYEVMEAVLSWREQLLLWLQRAYLWCGRNALPLAAVILLALVGWIRRRQVCDHLAVMIFRLGPGAEWRDWVRRAVEIIDRRCRWAGRLRPASQSPRRWYRLIAGSGESDHLNQLADLSDWAAYGPRAPFTQDRIWKVCRESLRSATVKDLRERKGQLQ
jgi:hypothetical protein